ncbi:uncharacterized protein LOC123475215 [Daphnia magna]|uniref:Uncharacterized protein n=1 Tax=Daphnia magna TaxID=35525 RepID=A0A164W599_9CRUS|nr:uncharacterized protein LOC116928312 [Daphnia magna]XP_045033502.1 uncharacterized protein LOC123475215 [Daphnia magna]KZS12960.1 Uncharacterized protein APZ42_022250 [Daphnia magna]
MNCLAKTKSQSDTTETTGGHLENSKDVIIAVTQHHRTLNSNGGQKQTSTSSRKESSRGTKTIVNLESEEMSPLKNYLNTLYGIADCDASAKLVRIIEPNEEEYFDSLAKEASQSKSEIECWHVHRQCFAWSFGIGSLIVLLGVTCLALGFLLPRHSALVNHVEPDFKKETLAHFNKGEENIVDRKAVEHNNVLDTMKVSGGMAVCFGSLLLLMAFILPPGNHPLKWTDEEDHPNIHQLNEALRNCGF